MTKLTEDIIRTKLKDWTLSSHLEKTFNNGMSNDEIKKQIEFFVTCGLVERTGERRGVKFKYKQDTALLTLAKSEEVEETGEESIEDTETYNAVHSLKDYEKEKSKSKEGISSIRTVDVVKFLTWLNDQTLYDASPISSYTLAFKKTRDNKILARAYTGLNVVKELVVTTSEFKKILSKLDSHTKKEEAIV